MQNTLIIKSSISFVGPITIITKWHIGASGSMQNKNIQQVYVTEWGMKFMLFDHTSFQGLGPQVRISNGSDH